MDFKTQFRAARRAAAPLVTVRTADPMSAMNLVKESLNGKAVTTPMLMWDCVRALNAINEPGIPVLDAVAGSEPLDTTLNPVDMLIRLGRMEPSRRFEGVISFVINAHLFWKEPSTMQAIWNLRDPFKMNGRMLILTTPIGSTLPPELADDVMVIDEPLPTPDELKIILRNVAESAGIVELTPEAEDKAIDAVVGIAAFPAESAMSMARLSDKTGFDVSMLWEKKRQAVEQIDGMTVHRGEAPEPVGLENARKFIKKAIAGRKRYRVILFVDEIEKAFAGTGTDMSGVKTGMTGTWCSWCTDKDVDGILCIGVPGGGKTMLAKWAGDSAGIPTVLFDFAGMQSGIIGSTEERLRKALATVDAISQGSVLIIGTCNGVGQLPPEVLRRFNLCTFFFDLLTEEERAACWKFYTKKFEIAVNKTNPIPDDEYWTGSEIRECCKQSYQLMIPLAEAATFIVPVYRSGGDRIRTLRQEASGKYISASKPGIYHADTQKAIPQAQQVRRFDYEETSTKPKEVSKTSR